MSSRKRRPPPPAREKRGVASLEAAGPWLARQSIEEIECVVPDLAGVARGKIMPVRKFLGAPSMNLPLAVFYQTITGDFPEMTGAISAVQSDTDIFLNPDFATLAVVPWAQDPTAQVIHDAVDRQLPGDRAERRARAVAAVGAFRSGRADVAERHDDHLADAFGP